MIQLFTRNNEHQYTMEQKSFKVVKEKPVNLEFYSQQKIPFKNEGEIKILSDRQN